MFFPAQGPVNGPEGIQEALQGNAELADQPRQEEAANGMDLLFLKDIFIEFSIFMAQLNVEWYSVHTYGVALREMAQRNVEWYSVHKNSVALCEMAQRNVEWYSVHANSVALREMA